MVHSRKVIIVQASWLLNESDGEVLLMGGVQVGPMEQTLDPHMH